MSSPTEWGASVGVIGGGIFGTTAACELAAAGFAVTLYEKRDDILGGTTSRNFFRVHRGYHYPRDLPTARDARAGFESFAQVFSAAFTEPVPHHYAIATTGSLTSVEQFEQHCERVGLRARRTRLPELVPGSVAACYEVDEAYYDTALLRKLSWEYLLSAQVRVELKSVRPARDIARTHDFVVVAAYGSLNRILTDLDCAPIELEHELCEVAIVRTPNLDRLSLVVMDGPFVSIGPFG
jgi:glycine/D-amino acid oxidase-like deaminating enzyme